MSRRLIADLTLLLTAILWGSTFVVQKLAFVDDTGAVATGDDTLGVLAFTGSRFILGALVILPLALRERARAPMVTARGDRWGFVLCGVLLFVGSYTQQVGIIHTSVTNAGFLTALYVPMVPVLALILFRTLPHWAVWPGAVGCTLGTWFLNGGRLDGFSEGDLWVIGSALFWALHVIAVGTFVGRSSRPLGAGLHPVLYRRCFGHGRCLHGGNPESWRHDRCGLRDRLCRCAVGRCGLYASGGWAAWRASGGCRR